MGRRCAAHPIQSHQPGAATRGVVDLRSQPLTLMVCEINLVVDSTLASGHKPWPRRSDAA